MDLPDVPIRLLGFNILVLRDQSPKTSGLLHIPDAYQEKLHSGVVLRAGPGYNAVCPSCSKSQGFLETIVKRGDRVLWKKFAEGANANTKNVRVPELEILDDEGRPREVLFLNAEADLLGRETEDGSWFELFGSELAIRRRDPAKSSGGIVIPDSAQKGDNEGIVVAVGLGTRVDGKFLRPAFNVGAHVQWDYDYSATVEPAFKKYQKPGEQLVRVSESSVIHAWDEELAAE